MKVFKVLSETDVARDQVRYRRPDSNVLRRWEVAATSHVDFRLVQQVVPLQTREFGVPLQPTNCTLPPYSRIPLTFVIDAALDHMVAWAQHGTAPRRGPDVETVGMPPVIVRDGFGNALGGIRLSQHAVPTATNTGLNTPAINFCRTFGTHRHGFRARHDAVFHGPSVMNARLAATNRTPPAGGVERKDAVKSTPESPLLGRGDPASASRSVLSEWRKCMPDCRCFY